MSVVKLTTSVHLLTLWVFIVLPDLSQKHRRHIKNKIQVFYSKKLLFSSRKRLSRRTLTHVSKKACRWWNISIELIKRENDNANTFLIGLVTVGWWNYSRCGAMNSFAWHVNTLRKSLEMIILLEIFERKTPERLSLPYCTILSNFSDGKHKWWGITKICVDRHKKRLETIRFSPWKRIAIPTLDQALQNEPLLSTSYQKLNENESQNNNHYLKAQET